MELAFISLSLVVSTLIIGEVTQYTLNKKHLFGIGEKKQASAPKDEKSIFEYEETSVSYVKRSDEE